MGALAEVAREIDLALCMTVNPGWGGQPFIAHSLEKLPRVRALVGAGVAVEVDGGIEPQTAPACLEAGASVFVAGSAIFSAADPGRGLPRDRRVRSTAADPAAQPEPRPNARARAAPVERRRASAPAAPSRRVADLRAQQLFADQRLSIHTTNTPPRATQQAAAARARSRASAAWLSAPEVRCRPMPRPISARPKRL